MIEKNFRMGSCLLGQCLFLKLGWLAMFQPRLLDCPVRLGVQERFQFSIDEVVGPPAREDFVHEEFVC